MSATKAVKNQDANVSSAKSQKRISFYVKLFLLYFLNIIDWICTEALLLSGKFYEGNPFMRSILGDFTLTILIKGALPLALVVVCALFYRFANVEENFITNCLLYGGIIVYTLIVIWHIANFVLLFWIF